MARLESLSGDIAHFRSRKQKLEGEIRNFANAIAEGGHSKYILDEIAVREREIGAITDRLLTSSSESLEGRITEMQTFVKKEIENLADLLNANSPLAKQEIHRHLTVVTMHPVGDGRTWHYEAEGSWNLLGTDKNAPHTEEQNAQDSREGRLRMVAGGRI
jgi:16S rRNA C1402 N4-methylase RsmH